MRRAALCLLLLLLPSLPCRADVDSDAFVTARDAAFAKLDGAKPAAARRTIEALFRSFAKELGAESERVDALLEREARGTASADQHTERLARERACDVGALTLAESTWRYARTFPAKDERREVTLRQAVRHYELASDLAGSDGVARGATRRPCRRSLSSTGR